jgi:hypothetical protein
MDVEDQTGRLARIYLIVGWAAVVLITIVSGLVYRRVAAGRVTYMAEGQAVAMAQRFITASGPGVRDLVREAPELSADELRSHPGAVEAGRVLLALREDYPVLKARVYGASGQIVASTEVEEIGRHTSDTVVLAMVAGRWWSRGRPDADSELRYVETLETAAGALRSVDLVITHVVIRPEVVSPDRTIQGVLGIDQDVGPEMERIRTTQALAMGSSIAIATLIAGAIWLQWRRVEG